MQYQLQPDHFERECTTPQPLRNGAMSEFINESINQFINESTIDWTNEWKITVKAKKMYCLKIHTWNTNRSISSHTVLIQARLSGMT